MNKKEKKNHKNAKIISIGEAEILSERERGSGSVVVLAHGVFDLLHIGHLRHLRMAREEGDILIVSITADDFVNKGPGRPAFPEMVRAEMLSGLELVDHVVINHNASSVDLINKICPSVYVKGIEYKDENKDVTGKISQEKHAVESNGGRVVFTEDIVHSSSSLINQFMGFHDPELHEYLREMHDNGILQSLLDGIEKISDYRVLVVGDAIVDEYIYVEPMGKAPKENIISTQYVGKEIFAGGVFAAANHVAALCKNVEVITCFGEDDSFEDLVRKNLKDNVVLHSIVRPGIPTTRKVRQVDPNYLRKLFETYYFDDSPLEETLQKEFNNMIRLAAKDFDLVIVTDFGHGLIADSTIAVLKESSKFLAVNAQCNSANYGYNLVTKYDKADYVCIDLREARLAVSDKYSSGENIMRYKLSKKIDCKNFVMTMGQSGCITYDTQLHHIPALTKTVIDTVGAGDAFFTATAPLVAAGLPLDQVGFVGNAVGAAMVAVVGHRSTLEKPDLIKTITSLLK